MINLINEYRAAKGCSVLQTNDALMKIAMQRALEYQVRDGNHSTPYNAHASAVLDTLGFNQKYYGEVTYEFVEICTGFGTSAEDALLAFQTSKSHDEQILDKRIGTKKVAVGVGIVNNGCVVCFFTSRYLPFTDYSNTLLKDYTSAEVVPFMTSIKSEAFFNQDNACTFYSTKEAAVAAAQDGSYKKHEDDCDCDDCLAEKDEEDSDDEEKENKTQKKIDTVKKTKISKPTVSKKRSGKNTKLTIKFNKTKKFSGAKYQIKVFKDKNCKKVLKSKNTKSSQWKVTINNKKYKKVYIKVRCYKKINGKTYYGKWSSVKTVKTK